MGDDFRLHALGGDAGKSRDQVGLHRARQQRRHPHAVVPAGEFRRVAERQQRVLGHGVADGRRDVAVALGVGRADVDDAAVRGLAQMRKRQPQQSERRHNVHVPHLREQGLLALVEADHAQHAGVVDEAVEPAEALDGVGDPFLSGVGVVRLEARGEDARSVVASERRRIANAEREHIAVGMQPSDYGRANATRGAGDGDHAALGLQKRFGDHALASMKRDRRRPWLPARGRH